MDIVELRKYIAQFLETEVDCVGTDEESDVPVDVQRSVLEHFADQLENYQEASS